MQATRFYDENQESQVGILPFDWLFNITDWYIAIWLVVWYHMVDILPFDWLFNITG
jgi:hypothetical protein